MGKPKDELDPQADLICPHCESPIERLALISRELEKRGPLGIRSHVHALACPACRRLVGIYPA
jgi:hypothetical protein